MKIELETTKVGVDGESFRYRLNYNSCKSFFDKLERREKEKLQIGQIYSIKLKTENDLMCYKNKDFFFIILTNNIDDKIFITPVYFKSIGKLLDDAEISLGIVDEISQSKVLIININQIQRLDYSKAVAMIRRDAKEIAKLNETFLRDAIVNKNNKLQSILSDKLVIN